MEKIGGMPADILPKFGEILMYSADLSTRVYARAVVIV